MSRTSTATENVYRGSTDPRVEPFLIMRDLSMLSVQFLPSIAIMQPNDFVETLGELELAEAIQRSTGRKATGTYSKDAAIRLFTESGFSFRQIREIWTIADREAKGKVTTEELCAVIRVAGWVQQRGAPVSDELLSKSGPLPVLKGILYTPRSAESRGYAHEATRPYFGAPQDMHSSAPVKDDRHQQMDAYNNRGQPEIDQPYEWHDQLQFPPITLDHMETCRRLFESAGHIHGLLDRETAEEVLMQHLNAPYLLLKTIFHLVRTSNRLSLNILEFTLAAYFVVGIQSRSIGALPSEVPKGLYDQLWTPTLLSPSQGGALKDRHHRDVSIVAFSHHTTPSAQSSESDLSTTVPLRLSPVRKEARLSFTQPCPSVSSVETRKITKLWKRVAKHCKISTVLRVSSTKSRKNKRESVRSSEVSIKGTVYSGSSESSFEALERDSFFQPSQGQRMSMDMTQLPLIYPSQSGYYSAPEHDPFEMRHSAGGHVYVLDDIVSLPSVVCDSIHAKERSPGDVETVKLIDSWDGMSGHEDDEYISAEPRKIGRNDYVLDLLKDMKEGYDLLRRQLHNMEKSIQQLDVHGLPATKSVRFASEAESVGWGGRVRDSVQMESSRRTQSLKTSKALAGPRDKLSLRSESSISTFGSHSYQHRRRSPHEKERVQGPRDVRRDRNSAYSNSSSVISLLESDETHFPKAPDYRRLPDPPTEDTTPALRSILKANFDKPEHRQLQTLEDDVTPDEDRSSSETDKPLRRLTKRSGMSEETLQAWNARFIIPPRSKDRELPKPPPRKLPVPRGIARKPEQQRLRHLPVIPHRVSTAPATSSSKVTNTTLEVEARSIPRMVIDPDPHTLPSSRRASIDSTVSDDIQAATSSAASSPRSSSDYSSSTSIFSRQRHSARTTLLTEIDEYNDAVVNDLREAAPQLVSQIQKSLLRELRTKSGSMNEDLVAAQSHLAAELEEALAELTAKEYQIRSLEETHAEVHRQHVQQVSKLEQENEEMRWTIDDQQDLIYSLLHPGHGSFEPPEYTPRWQSI